jgi:Tfp pilus assembly protein PilF
MKTCKGLSHASTSFPGVSPFLAAFLLSALIFLIYSNSLDCSWQFDDITNIRNNKYLHIEDLSLENLKRTLVADPGRPGNLYRPVACLTFGLNYYFGGLHVLGYHLVNIVVHILCSLLLFLFLHHTLNSFSFGRQYASRSNLIALMAALMWAMHPIQVQSVTYIVQRMNSLAGLFYILSMYFYAKGRTTHKNGLRVTFICLCAVSFAMAFGAKENAVLLPVSLVLYEILVIQKANLASIRDHIGAILIVFVGVFLFSLLYLHYWRGGVYSFLAGYEVRPFSLSGRLLTEPRIILFYVSLLIYPVPHRFSVAHTVETSSSLIDPISTLLSILAITGSVVFLILRARKNPLISFSFLFFLLNHLVESSVFPLELVFEHRNYVHSMMFFLPFALWFNALLNLRVGRLAVKYLVLGLTVSVLVFFGYSTHLRNLVWKNPGTLWTDALQKAPDQLRVHHNLAMYYHDSGFKTEALFHYLQALRSPVIHRKDEPVGAYYQLGKLYGEMGEYEKAKSAYKQAIFMKPDLAWALVGLASVYDQQGDRTTANEYLTKALKVGPGDPSVNLNVGLYYLRARNPEAAIRHLAIALKDKNLESKSLMYLGIASKERGQYAVSENQFKRSLVLNPKNITPHLHLAEIYIRTGRETEARMEVERIISLVVRDRNLLWEVVNLIVTEGDRGDVDLSEELLLPFIARALEDTPNGPMREEIKKIMEKRTEIR